MDAEILSRIQFALTASFHFIFPPLSMGLGLLMVAMGVFYLRSGDPVWRQSSFFWVRVYGLIFAMGIATGIVQEFQFGTNWSQYSKFVGNVFGSLLAAEGVFAFFLEGGFLGLMLFGGDRLGPKLWLFATSMVTFGAHFSAVWILMANSWMQTPDGYKIGQTDFGNAAFMTDFASIAFTPSFLPRLMHVWVASWMIGAGLVMSVGAWYLLKNRHLEFARKNLMLGLWTFAVLAVLQVLIFGGLMAGAVTNHQEVKLAAMEGVWESDSCAPMYLVGWVNEGDQSTGGLKIPCLLSVLAYKNPSSTVDGLTTYPSDLWAPVNLTFQVYHVMIDLGFLFVLIGLAGLFFWWRKRRLLEARLMLWVLVVTVVMAEVASIAGWWTGEVGRQPWVVWNLLKTTDAVSSTLSPGEVLASIVMFALLYAILFVLFLILLNRKIQDGPQEPESIPSVTNLPDTFREVFRRSRVDA